MASVKIADAIESKDWRKARYLTTLKVAKAMDNTESSREIKALSLSLVELIAECEKDSEQTHSKPNVTAIVSNSKWARGRAANE